MVSILEVYQLQCTQCGKPKRVTHLHVDGNLAEIEAKFVCDPCLTAPAESNKSAKSAETA